MEKIIRYFIIAILIGIISRCYPYAISYGKPIQVFASLLIIWLTEFLLIRVLILIGMIFSKGNYTILFTYMYFISVLFTPLALFVSKNYLVGLQINGFWSYVMVVIIISVVKMF